MPEIGILLNPSFDYFLKLSQGFIGHFKGVFRSGKISFQDIAVVFFKCFDDYCSDAGVASG